MELMKLAGLCVICLLPVVLLRKSTPEQALLLTAAILLAVRMRCLQSAVPLLEKMKSLFAQAGIETLYISVLLRTVGAAVVTRVCADLCRDGGSQSLAGAVEIAGAVAAVLIAMPLLEAVIQLLLGYFTEESVS